MDTIQITLKINEAKLKGVQLDQLNIVCNFIDGIRSPAGYNYCDVKRISGVSNIIVKISYPRWHAGNNATLIKTINQCKQVNKHFCDSIGKHPLLEDAIIYLTRVDIPFTFMMPEKHNFQSYSKIYEIFDYIYRRKNPKSTPKVFCRLQDMYKETVYYTDTINPSKYNTKIMIYNQYMNTKAKTKTDAEFKNILNANPDLKQRMRIEVSKRIKRSGFTRLEFREFDIATEYLPKYKKYILDNLFDPSVLEEFYRKQVNELAADFIRYRERNLSFSYELFILKNMHKIYDYEILRRALNICILNINTRESAITVVRRVLNKYEKEHNIIVMNSYQEFHRIKDSIEKQKLKENKSYRTFMYR